MLVPIIAPYCRIIGIKSLLWQQTIVHGWPSKQLESKNLRKVWAWGLSYILWSFFMIISCKANWNWMQQLALSLRQRPGDEYINNGICRFTQKIPHFNPDLGNSRIFRKIILFLLGILSWLSKGWNLCVSIFFSQISIRVKFDLKIQLGFRRRPSSCMF